MTAAALRASPRELERQPDTGVRATGFAIFFRGVNGTFIGDDFFGEKTMNARECRIYANPDRFSSKSGVYPSATDWLFHLFILCAKRDESLDDRDDLRSSFFEGNAEFYFKTT